MKNNDKKKFAGLRKRARKFLAVNPDAVLSMPPDDIKALVQEFNTYQIELELQNEELRITQQALEQSRQRFTDLYEFAPVGYFTFDEKGLILAVNNTGICQLGIKKEAWRKKPFTSFMSNDDSDLFYLHIKKVFATGSKQTCTLALLRENDKPFYAQLDSIPFYNVHGSYPTCLTTVTDINDRKELEESLKVSETRYRRLFETAGLGILLIDAQTGQIADANPFLTEMLGYSREELVGKKIWEIGWIEDVEASKTVFAALQRQGHVRYDDLPLKTKSGRSISVEVISTFYLVDHQKVVQCNVRDITRRKIMAAALQEVNDNAGLQSEESLRKALEEIKSLRDRLVIENIFFRQEIQRKQQFDQIIGQSDGIKYVLYRVEQVAPINTTVLILGETGTGKELIANAIHKLSPRSKQPFITVNCAALPANLLESELFGREKGAFTGADSRQIGRFEVADGSTLCLDEIGELPLEMQAKLLRVIQHGEFERLGSSRTVKVDVRIVATTNRNLEEAITDNKFRKDLFYRLNVFPITVPPLRQRQEDIPLMVEAFVERYARKMGKKITTIPKKTMQALQDYPWPGNVRELESVIERAVILCPGPGFQLADELVVSSSPISIAGGTVKEMERCLILKVLSDTGWRIEGKDGAAMILGLHPSTLRARMHKLGIVRPESTESG